MMRIFFYSCKDKQELETIINNEFKCLLGYCNTNKLSVNFKKTHYRVISSSHKNIQINISNIQQKNCIKYLGVYIDNKLSWTPHISHVNDKISKNIGIINKLRYYLDLHVLKQLYYSLIYPYQQYGIKLG